MLHVSFAMTSGAFADRTKTETRRFWKPSHAAKFKPGREFMGITKDFRAGGVRMHAARVVFCKQQTLSEMTADSFEREGGMRYWKNLAAYVEMMGGPAMRPWVFRFEHLPNDYPANWKEIAYQIKTAAGWKCARCKHPNDLPSGHVLTVHHLDGNKANCADWNLAALCQRCHLSVQGHVRMDQLFFAEILDVAEWFKPHLAGYLKSKAK